MALQIMAANEQKFEGFAEYARERLDKGDVDLSIDELFDLWRAENPSDAEHRENVAAIAASIDDFKYGYRGTLAGRLNRELRRELGLPEEQS